MQLHCPLCQAQIHADDIQLDRVLAKCRACHAVFDFSDQVAREPQGDRASEQLRRAPLAVPAGITVHVDAPADIEPGYRDAPRSRGTITIVRTWRASSTWGMAIFCVFWNAFLVFWYSITSNAPLIFRLFPLIHVTVGVVMTYRTIAALLNTTRITVSDEAIDIRHRPVPWPGNRRIATAEVEQLFAEEQITPQKGGESRTYHLNAILKDGTTVRLVSGLDQPDTPRFLEQRIEEHLGIADIEVSGEHRL